MLDIELFRSNLEKIIESENKRFKDPSNVENVFEQDKKWRSVLATIQDLRQKRNEFSAQIGEFKKAGEHEKANEAVKASKEIKKKIEALETEKSKYFDEREKLRYTIGNILHDSVPFAKTEENNEILRNVGKIPEFNFEPLNHVKLIETIQGGSCEMS